MPRLLEVVCVLCVDSEAAFPKAPQHTILKTTNKQTTTHIKAFVFPHSIYHSVTMAE